MLLSGFNSVNALEVAEGWIEYESGTVSVDIDKITEFEERLTYRVNEFNRLNLDRVYRYRIEVATEDGLDDYMEVANDMAFESVEDALEWANNNAPEVDGWSFIENNVNAFEVDRTLPTTRYETEEEADKAVTEFESTIDEDTGSVSINEIRDEDGDVTESVLNNSKYNTFDGAYNASLELRSETHDYIITVEVVTNDPEYVRTDTLTFDVTLNSLDEVSKYIAGLELDGYTVKYEITEVNEYETLDKVYETVEEANEALAKFLSDYPETTVANVEEVRDESGDVVVDVENNYRFDTEEEATEKANSLKEDTHYYVVDVTVVKEDPEFVETVEESFEVAFDDESKALAYVAGLELDGYTVKYEITEVNEYATLDKVYETEEEANDALAEFLRNYPETTVTDVEEVRDETGDVTVKVENNYKFDTFDGAYNASLELIDNNHDYIVEVNVYAGDPELVDTETLTLSMIFDSRDAALDFIISLENDGYTVEYNIEEVTEIVTLNQTYDTYIAASEALEAFRNECQSLTSFDIDEVRDEEEDVVSTVTGTVEYATREEALEVAAGLNVSADKYEVVASVREGSKTVVVGPTDIESDQFDSREEAQAYIDELEAQGYDVSNLEIELVSFDESIWGDEDDVIVNPGEGDTSSFKYGHFDIKLLTQFTKIDAEGNETTVEGIITISKVLIDDDEIEMSGPSIDPNEGYTEYTSDERNKLNVNQNSLVEIIGTVAYYTDETKATLSTPIEFTIIGYLTEDQNACGGTLGRDKGFDLEFESVTIVNNRVVIDTNVVSKFKVTGTVTRAEEVAVYYVDTTTTNYGYDYNVNAEGIKLVGYSLSGTAVKETYKDVYLLDINKTILDYDYKVTAEGVKFIEYLLNGTASKDIYKDVYTLAMTRTTLDYDYRVTAEGVKFIGISLEGTASKDIYEDVYTLDVKKIIKDYDYEVSGSGIKTYYDVISKYVRLTDVNYIIEYMELGKGGDVEELPPQTGVNNSNSYNVIAILLMGIILVIKKFI